MFGPAENLSSFSSDNLREPTRWMLGQVHLLETLFNVTALVLYRWAHCISLL